MHEDCVCVCVCVGVGACTSTWVDDLLFFTEGHPGASPLPLGSLDVQVALLDSESRDALVVGCVKLCQVLSQEHMYSIGTVQISSIQESHQLTPNIRFPNS